MTYLSIIDVEHKNEIKSMLTEEIRSFLLYLSCIHNFFLVFFINISELPPPSTTINRPYTSLITPTTIRSQREFLIRTIFMTNSNNASKIKMK